MSSSTDTSIAQALIGWAGVPVVPNSVMFLALLGFANALVWPAVWPLALEGLGKYTAAGSALINHGYCRWRDFADGVWSLFRYRWRTRCLLGDVALLCDDFVLCAQRPQDHQLEINFFYLNPHVKSQFA